MNPQFAFFSLVACAAANRRINEIVDQKNFAAIASGELHQYAEICILTLMYYLKLLDAPMSVCQEAMERLPVKFGRIG